MVFTDVLLGGLDNELSSKVISRLPSLALYCTVIRSVDLDIPYHSGEIGEGGCLAFTHGSDYIRKKGR